MAVDAVTAAAAAKTTQAQKSLSGNFDTFLRLLTTQLQNQNPLEPLDATKFTEQLVSYSQVEQQINTNQNLTALLALQKVALGANAVSYLGKTAVTTGPLSSIDGGTASWRYTLPSDAAAVDLVVTDSTGRLVRSVPGQLNVGTHEFVWDGKNTAGETLPEGAYRLTVVAKRADQSEIEAAVTGIGLVREVDMSGAEPVVTIGKRKVNLTEVVGLKN